MKNEHPAFLSEQDDIVNSLNYEGIAVIELQFLPLSDSDRLRVGSVWTKQFEWLAVMVISQPQGIILHIIIVLHQRYLNCSEYFQNPYVLYMQLQHQGNS